MTIEEDTMRNRYDKLSVIKDLGAETTSTTSEAKEFGNLPEATLLVANVVQVSGTDAALNLVIEASNDGSTWNEIATIENITSAGQYLRSIGSAPFRYYRSKSSISGTNPSFDYEVYLTV